MTNAPKKKAGIKDALMRLGPALALILMFIVFAIVMPGKFLRIGNLMNVLKQASINCMIGAGMLLCLITAGIDLSVGYNCTLACCIIGVLLNLGVTSPFLLIPAALLVSTLAGVYLPGEHCLLHEVDAKFARPVFIGDVLTVSGRVFEVNETFREITVKYSITNQDGKKVTRGIYKAGLAE